MVLKIYWALNVHKLDLIYYYRGHIFISINNKDKITTQIELFQMGKIRNKPQCLYLNLKNWYKHVK